MKEITEKESILQGFEDISRNKESNCFKGNNYSISHVGYQHETPSKSTAQKTASWTPAGKHGDECSWMSKGKCMFYHKDVGEQRSSRHAQQTPNQTRDRQVRGRGPCKFASRSNRIETWSHKENHKSNKCFPKQTRRNQQPRSIAGRSN